MPDWNDLSQDEKDEITRAVDMWTDDDATQIAVVAYACIRRQYAQRVARDLDGFSAETIAELKQL